MTIEPRASLLLTVCRGCGYVLLVNGMKLDELGLSSKTDIKAFREGRCPSCGRPLDLDEPDVEVYELEEFSRRYRLGEHLKEREGEHSLDSAS